MNRSLGVAAAIGAGVTLVSGVVPFVQLVAPMVGGGAAAYVSNASPKRGIKFGGAAGVLALSVYLPVALLGAVVLVSSAATTPVADGTGAGVGLAAVSLVLLLTVLVPTTSALGGALGGVVNERRRETADAPTADADADADDAAETPIERLEQRYVDGEIEEPRFEHRLDTILENRYRHGTPDNGSGGEPGRRGEPSADSRELRPAEE